MKLKNNYGTSVSSIIIAIKNALIVIWNVVLEWSIQISNNKN